MPDRAREASVNTAPIMAPPPEAINADGRAGAVIVCEHASRHIPTALGDLGLSPAALASHIAWDPGALGVARELSRLMDAPLLAATTSRLVYDLNRPPEAPGAMPARSETYDIPGNAGLNAAARAARIAAVHAPWHAGLGAMIAARPGPPAIITVHSFTPVFHGAPRATEIGVLHDDDDARLGDALIAALGAEGRYRIARNNPYGPEDGVTHTLRVHALPKGLLNVMIEIRNDLIADPAAESAMAGLLARALGAALAVSGGDDA